MKITGLKTFVVAAAPRGGNWVFVKLYTDQDGLRLGRRRLAVLWY
ncbi:MAG TPA: hypothetical protein VGL23_14950 [Chloroflexota bacterium]